jgi:hypothetical protein
MPIGIGILPNVDIHVTAASAAGFSEGAAAVFVINKYASTSVNADTAFITK